MGMTFRLSLRRWAAVALATVLTGAGLLGLGAVAAASANAAITAGVPSVVVADNPCGDDTREGEWAWWKNPKPKPCYRYTFDTLDDGSIGGRPPKDPGQGAGGGVTPQGGGTSGGGGQGGTDQGVTPQGNGDQGGVGAGGAAGAGGSDAQSDGPAGGGQAPRPDSIDGTDQTSTGTGVAGPVTVTDVVDINAEQSGEPAADTPASEDAQAAGIDLSGGGPQPRTLLPWLPAGAFWGAVAVLIAGLAALTAYFLRRD
jgi:hypothetical protein